MASAGDTKAASHQSRIGREDFPAFPHKPYDIQKDFMASLYRALEKGGVGLFESPTGTGKTLSLICSVLQWLEDQPVTAVPTAAEQQEGSSTCLATVRARVTMLLYPSGSTILNVPSLSIARLPTLLDAASAVQVFFCSRTHSQLSQFVSELRRTPFADTVETVALASRKALCVNDDVLKLGSLSRINDRCLELKKGKPKKQAAEAATLKPKARKASGKCPFLQAKSQTKTNVQEAILAQPLDVEDLAKLGRSKLVCPYYTVRSAVPDAQLVLLPYSALLAQESRDALQLHLKGSIIVVDEAHNLVDAVNGAHTAQLSLHQLTAAEAQLSSYFQCFRTRLAAGNSQHIQSIISLAAALRTALESPGTLLVQHAQHSQQEQQSQAQQHIQTVNDFLFRTQLDGVNMFKLVRYVKESKVLFKVAGYADAVQARADSKRAQQHSSHAEAQSVSGGQAADVHALVGFMTALTNADADGRILVDYQAATLKFVLLNAAAHFAKVVEQAHAVVLASGTLSPVASLTRQLFPGLPPTAITHFSCGHVVPKENLLAIALAQGPSGARLELRHDKRGSSASLDEVGRLLLNICKCTPQGVVAFFPAFAHCDQLYSRWQQTGLLAQIAAKKTIFKEPRAASEVDAMLQQYAECITPSGVMAGKASGTASTAASPAGKASAAAVTGGLMLCVVGGKLSEGINFSDGFGRCVVMVGMPYPNPIDPELQERMRFIDTQQQHALQPEGPSPLAALSSHNNRSLHSGQKDTSPSCNTGSGTLLCPDAGSSRQCHVARSDTSAGKEYYEDLCLKAVNQCIGRVIRHRGDYAAIILADARWVTGNENVQPGSDLRLAGPLRKLPMWIQESLCTCKTFGEAYGRLHRFHRQMLDAHGS